MTGAPHLAGRSPIAGRGFVWPPVRELLPQLTAANWWLVVRPGRRGGKDSERRFPLTHVDPADPIAFLLDCVSQVAGEGWARIRLRARRSVVADRARLGLPSSQMPFELVRGDQTRPSGLPGTSLRHVQVDDDDEPDDVAPLSSAEEREQRETARLRAQIDRRQAELDLARVEREFAAAQPQQAPAANASRDLFVVLLEQQAQTFRLLLDAASKREAELLAALRERGAVGQVAPTPAPAVDPLGSAVDLVRKVLSVADDIRGAGGGGGDDGESGELVKILREAKGLLQIGAAAGGSPGGSIGARPEVVPAPRPALRQVRRAGVGDDVSKMREDRCSRFVGSLISEARNGSDAATVADRLADQAGLLPPTVRQGIEAGNWRAAWQAMAPFLGEGWHGLDSLLVADAAASQWVQECIAELAAVLADDGEPETDDDAAPEVEP